MENINNTDKGIGWLERVMVLVSKYSVLQFLKAFLIILIIFCLVGFISNPTYIFEKYKEWDNQQHQLEMIEGEKNNLIIQSEIESLLWRTNADRVLLLSYHNTKSSLTGVPYIYLTAINEYIADGVKPVAEGYNSIKTSLYPMISYIGQKSFFCGDIEELKVIDKALAYRMEGNDVKHLAMLQIEGDLPLGVLVVTFTEDMDNQHDCKEIEELIRKSALKIGVLLENKN